MVLVAFYLSLALAKMLVPPLSGPVMDQASLLNTSDEREIERVLRAVHRRGIAQIQVLSVNSLGGESIEQASIRAVDIWKLGDPKKDNGLLILIAKDERRIRIEVGQGLEGDIPDAYARRIIDDLMQPAFRQRAFAAGVMLAVRQIVAHIAPEVDTTALATRSYAKKSRSKELPVWVILLFIFIFLSRYGGWLGLLSPALGGRRGWSSHWPRGGGGFSGGGWSGGGGGFSGGGASGGW